MRKEELLDLVGPLDEVGRSAITRPHARDLEALGARDRTFGDQYLWRCHGVVAEWRWIVVKRIVQDELVFLRNHVRSQRPPHSNECGRDRVTVS